MKAAFKRGLDVTLRDAELPALRPEDIRLTVSACGICGSDLHVNPDEADQEGGFGHEVAGVVAEVGSAVQNLTVGQPVVLESATACGRCANCRNARQELCTDIQSFWFTQSFGMAEEMVTPAATAIPCDYLRPEVALLCEPLGVAIDLVRLAEIGPDNNVLLLGAGPIGLMALALVHRAGARRIFVSELASRPARLALAGEFGADVIVDPQATPIETYDFGCPIDRILVTSPPPTLPGAFQVATKGAILSFIGIGHGESAFCRFNVNDFHFKKLQLRASFASPALFTPRALQYLREGVVDGGALISHRFPLSQIAEAMRVAREDPGALKVVIQP